MTTIQPQAHGFCMAVMGTIYRTNNIVESVDCSDSGMESTQSQNIACISAFVPKVHDEMHENA